MDWICCTAKAKFHNVFTGQNACSKDAGFLLDKVAIGIRKPNVDIG
jgi:hypothetical protein